MFEAKIIADSICGGHRLTTMQLTHPRIVHAEFNTHCMFARNASSSRAIPFATMVQKVIDDPFVPQKFGVNQKGMQAFTYLQGADRETAIRLWLKARDNAIDVAWQLAAPEGLNLHKQLANRLLEPWMWITVCVTGDEGAWSNYFSLRCHPDAEDNIQTQAYMAQKLYFTSTPAEVKPRSWHLPYLDQAEIADLDKFAEEDGEFTAADSRIMVSVGRCARTSYLTQEGKRDFAEDIKLHDRLRFHRPLHASPFEHVCQAQPDGNRYGKYLGWRAYRHMLPREYVTDFKPNHPDLTESVHGESS